MRKQEEFNKLVKNAHETDQQLISNQVEKMYDLDNHFRTGPAVYYLFNFTKMRYEYLSAGHAKLTGYELDAYKDGDIPLLDIMLEEDLRVYMSRVIPALREYRNQYSIRENGNMTFQITARLRKKDGQVIRILDQYNFVDLDEENMPLLIFGHLSEISVPNLNEPVSAAIYLEKEDYSERIYFKSFSDNDNVQVSDREKQVIKLLASGKTSKEIANELFISSNTVSRHRQNILSKLGIGSTTELVKYAVEHGLG